MSSAFSVSSVGSYVTDIARSSLFRGANKSGVAEFHLPKDSFHIVMNPHLHPGSVYKVPAHNETEKFLDYYMVASAGGDEIWQDLLDDLDEEHGIACHCQCDQ